MPTKPLTISTLIKQLQAIKKEQGDLPCVVAEGDEFVPFTLVFDDERVVLLEDV